MKLRNLRLERQPKLMIIPMIDIIFFLLVYFMMSTLYMVEQRTLPVNLPQAAAAQSDLQKNVAITVARDGML
ncbi:MAG TPA: biopolymer transporter ExbD, partial [Firmicutes bacterium]|nr:biopolymer transporter ExbD [Bacillota bacterium]